jgi:hypothetical protein
MVSRSSASTAMMTTVQTTDMRASCLRTWPDADVRAGADGAGFNGEKSGHVRRVARRQPRGLE